VTILTDAIVPVLKARFIGRPVIFGNPPGPVATFPAAHADVGDLVIDDDGDEFTVYVGKFTHVHFSDYDESLTESARAARIVDNLVSFLDDVFADRMEFFGSHTGGGGCRKRGAEPRGMVSRLFFGAKTYVWSGPVSGTG
jgi:hypothetical protein